VVKLTKQGKQEKKRKKKKPKKATWRGGGQTNREQNKQTNTHKKIPGSGTIEY
jgi:hypothetical protein